MNTDYYLKFLDHETAKVVLKKLSFIDEENNYITDSSNHCLIVIGKIYKRQTVDRVEQNIEIEGFFINLFLRNDASQEIAIALSEYLCPEPVTPNNMRFGGNIDYSNETALLAFLSEEIL
ncbi:MAG: hypothetical protein V7K21_19235 [Nostoc sp.]|uniref:hypothetical protein n=1 Tax=Nostoc sp. TaxID=1180 RepID=UPI002FF5DF85